MKNASAVALLLLGMLIGTLLMSFRPAPIVVPVQAASPTPPIDLEPTLPRAPIQAIENIPPAPAPEVLVIQPPEPPKEPAVISVINPIAAVVAAQCLPAIEPKPPEPEKKEPQVPVEVEDPRFLTLLGRVAANLDVDVKCKVSGQIVQLPVEVGDVVEKGQVLAEIDASDEERGVLRAQLSVKSSQTRLEQSRQALEIAEQSLVISKARVDAAMR